MSINNCINLIINYADLPKAADPIRQILQTIFVLSDEDVVCQTTITEKPTKISVEVLVTSRVNEEGLKTYKVWHNRNLLGTIELDYLDILGNGKLGSAIYPDGVHQQLIGYGEDSSKPVKKIYIENLESFSRKKYSGVGSLLLRMAYQESALKGCKGKIMTYAISNSPGFYYKCGYRHVNPENNKLIKEAIEKASSQKKQKIPNTKLYIGEMYFDEV